MRSQLQLQVAGILEVTEGKDGDRDIEPQNVGVDLEVSEAQLRYVGVEVERKVISKCMHPHWSWH